MGCDSPGKDMHVNPFPVSRSSVQACRDLFDSFSICLINRPKALERKRLQLWGKMDAVCSAPSTELDGRRQQLPPGRALWQLQKELVLFQKLGLKQTHLETKDKTANGKGISVCSILNKIQRAFFLYYGHYSHLPHGVPRSLKNNKRQTINTEFGEQARPPPDEASNCVFAQNEVSIHLVAQAFSTGDTLDGYSDSSFSGLVNRSAPE